MLDRTPFATRLLPLCALVALLGACGEATNDAPAQEAEPQVEEDNFSPPLMDLDELVSEHPQENGVQLQDLSSKYDLTLPESFDVVDLQTDVRSQASRGVCSVFSTVALMEHLYLKQGMKAPDFSEQYLQWSVKTQVGSFPNTSGSSANSNLSAVRRFGIPQEEAWPYVTRKWTESDDPRCGKPEEGKKKPTVCFAQGERAPEAARDAKKFFLPRSIALNNDVNSLKTYMVKNERAFVCGMDFFYQAWSHGGSKLKTNKDHRAQGFIPFPSAEDRADSETRPAGHSVLLGAYDDNVEIARLDTEGKPMLDGNGNPIVDKGAFAIKNSWGANSTGWGGKHKFGAGYGWISYRYIANFGRCVGAPEPRKSSFEEPVPVEICGDDKDNDGNMLVDCDDAACKDDVTCKQAELTKTFTSTDNVSIPDNDNKGADATLSVDLDGKVRTLELSYEIEHSFSGDLEIILIAPDGENFAIVREASDDSTENLKETLKLSDFKGVDASGEWTLNVTDTAAADTGSVVKWELTISK